MEHRLSRDPQDALERLTLYESSDNVRRRYQAVHERELGAGKAREIAAHVRQGRQLLQTAAMTPLNVRPLVVYYAVVALSRALILFRDQSKRESSIAPAHGVQEHQWPQALSKGVGDLSHLHLRLNLRGTFSELARATLSSDYCEIYVDSEGICGWRSIGTAVLHSVVDVTLQDVLRSIPDLRQISQFTFRKRPKCHRAIVTLWDPEVYDEEKWEGEGIERLEVAFVIVPFNEVSELVIKSIMNLPEEYKIELKNENLREGKISAYVVEVPIREARSGAFGPRLPHLSRDRRGRVFVVEEIGPGVQLSQLLLLFLAAFGLGNLARYYPSHWLSLQDSTTGDLAFPLLQQALNLVATAFPALIADEFEQARVRHLWPGGHLIPLFLLHGFEE